MTTAPAGGEPSQRFSLQRARKFATKYAETTQEKQYEQRFWSDFFQRVCGIPDLMDAGIEFEYPVKSITTGTTNFIDVLWAGVLLIEHKTAGKDLDSAEKQARGYVASLPHALRPPVIIVSDFARWRIIHIIENTRYEFQLSDLPANLYRIEAIIGSHVEDAVHPQVEADQKAVELMGNLYTEFEKAGYTGDVVSKFLVRLLFLNFGDDTGMWKHTGDGLFGSVVAGSNEDGSGLGGLIGEVFQVLNTPDSKRPHTLSKTLAEFPYVNGGLFAESLPIFSFTAEMRDALLATTHYDWSKISPAIFGAMFQAVKSRDLRRESGEFYTSEANILKVIRPLFLDDLLDKLHRRWNSPSLLKQLREELGTYNFLDPASGSGNFLLVAYQRLRDLELKIIVRLQVLGYLESQTGLAGLGNYGLSVHLGQFHAIEYDEWSSEIARVAMWLADHQANLELEEITGQSSNRFPLTESADIHHENALKFDWTKACPMNQNTIIMGNPPFVGARLQSKEQKEETKTVWKDVRGVGNLDYVSNWFLIASRLVARYGGKCGLVATNSIAQGIQPAIIWGQLNRLGVGIDFAHRTFRWDNLSPKTASVHCVIIGFSARQKPARRPLWLYKTPTSLPEPTTASTINGYLLDAPNVLIENRTTPLSPDTPPMVFGSMPNDGGYLSNISPDEAEQIRDSDPVASRYLHPIIGAREFLHHEERWCLWLNDANPSDIRTSRVLSERVEAVRLLRSQSVRAGTRALAETPASFGEIRQPSTRYLAVPQVSSINREYIPVGWEQPTTVASNLLYVIPTATLALFGFLSSRPFTLWANTVSGKMKSDFRISNGITYNNFPFPAITDEQEDELSASAEAVLTARQDYPDASLDDLYSPTAMPPKLRKAHRDLDRAVLRALGLKLSASDEQVLTRLFTLYSDALRGLLAPEATKVKRSRRRY